MEDDAQKIIDSSRIQEVLRKVEGVLKELQTVTVDIAVIKTKTEGIEEDIKRLNKAVFNGNNPKGNIFDRLNEVEVFAESTKALDMPQKISNLERSKVETVECRRVHGEISTKLWKIFIPIIVAFILAIGSALFGNMFILKRDAEDIELKIKQAVQQELRYNTSRNQGSVTK